MAYTTINKPNTNFNPVLYTGNGGTQSITGAGFQPDWTWIKRRDADSWHQVNDSVRGAGKVIHTNVTNAEGTQTNNLTSFDTDGFSVGNGDVNNSSAPFVSWNWKAGGTAVSNTDGSITSSVSANTTAGFSVVTYTSNGTSGATVGHGLGVAPSMIIVKRRNSAEDWGVGHQSLTWNNFLRLNTSGASSASAGLWNNTAPDSDKFTLGNSGISNNGSGTTMVAYCFAEKQGYSKFGSYVGNGSTDGTFIYTGFKPSWIIFKRSDGVQDWYMYDNKRSPSNVAQAQLDAMDSSAEGSLLSGDFLSNGFKLRSVSSAFNTSGGTFIYMAFAENPLVGTNNVPATAR